MKQIHDSLERVFDRHRIVFWYDPNADWIDAFQSFSDEAVTKLEVRNTSSDQGPDRDGP